MLHRPQDLETAVSLATLQDKVIDMMRLIVTRGPLYVQSTAGATPGSISCSYWWAGGRRLAFSHTTGYQAQPRHREDYPKPKYLYGRQAQGSPGVQEGVGIVFHMR